MDYIPYSYLKMILIGLGIQFIVTCFHCSGWDFFAGTDPAIDEFVANRRTIRLMVGLRCLFGVGINRHDAYRAGGSLFVIINNYHFGMWLNPERKEGHPDYKPRNLDK